MPVKNPREWFKLRRLRAKKEGKCTDCWKNKPSEGRLQCEECSSYGRTIASKPEAIALKREYNRTHIRKNPGKRQPRQNLPKPIIPKIIIPKITKTIISRKLINFKKEHAQYHDIDRAE